MQKWTVYLSLSIPQIPLPESSHVVSGAREAPEGKLPIQNYV
jgi:hypothetical protein